jgi:peptide/nickel transport system permease protein
MLSFVARRALAIVPLIVIATAAAFFMLQLSDVDPAVVKLGETATEEQYAVVRAELGTDRPAVVQYADWLVHSARLDFGESWQRPVEVTTLIRQRLPATLSLTLGAVLVTVLLGLPLGVAAGIRAGSGADSLITAGASIGQAVPAFWAALLLAAYVAVPYDLFPATGFVGPTSSVLDWLRSLALPAVALGVGGAAAAARQTRAAVAGALRQPHVRTAVSIGYSRATVLRSDVLRNAAIPVVTVLGVQVSLLLGGSLIVEQVFAIPGLGSLAFSSILQNDLPVVLGVVTVSAVMVSIVQLLLDVLYGLLDPRVRVG